MTDDARPRNRVNARWLWERVPSAVRNDEEMSRIWEVAKLLWNSDISAAHTMITSAGACRLLPFLALQSACGVALRMS